MGIHVRRQGGATRLWLVAAAAVAAGGATFVVPRTLAVHAASPPAVVQAQGISDTVAEVTWTAVPGAASYTVFRDGGQIATGLTQTTYDDSGLLQGSTHSYTVSADTSGQSGAASATTQVTPPQRSISAPSNFAVTQTMAGAPPAVVPGSLTFSFKAGTGGVSGYRIYVTDAGGGNLHLVQTTDRSSLSFGGLQASTTYGFAAQAIGPNGEMNPSTPPTVAQASNTPAAPIAFAVNPPSSVHATLFSATRVDLTISENSADATAGKIHGYAITRSPAFTTPACPAPISAPCVTLLEPSASSTRYSDNTVSAGTPYVYTVQTIGLDNATVSTGVNSAQVTPTVGLKVTRGPYVQSATSNSARIVWWTNQASQSVVTYGIGSPTGTTLTDATNTAYEHVMLVGPLSPGTVYDYVVGDGTTNGCPNPAPSTGQCQFFTAAAPGSTFTFDALADYGGGSSRPGEAGNAFNIANDGAQFLQTLGDNVYPDATDPNYLTTISDFDTHLYHPVTGTTSISGALGTVMGAMDFVPSNGNVDYYGSSQVTNLANVAGAQHGAGTPPWFQNNFMPNNQKWYGYDWGDTHVTVLDPIQDLTTGTPQYNFLVSDLAAHQGAVWRIVVVQNPPYSSTSNNSSSAAIQALIPAFQTYRVQFVLSGNSHNYERTQSLYNGAVASPGSYGITYIVSGAGGNGFNKFTIAQPATTAFREDTTYEHLKITESPTQLTITAMDSLNPSGIIDSVSIQAAITPPPGPTPTPTPTPTPGPGPGPGPGSGYWLVATDGGIFPFGKAVGYGSTGNIHLNKPIVGMATTASGNGYWLVATDGGIFPFGDAVQHSYGSTGGIHLNQPIVGMARTASGNGYWLVATDGGIFPFGDATLHSYGSTGGIHLNQPIVGMARTASGNGYWLVATDGGIFPFGDAVLHSYGSTGGIHLNKPIVGMAPTGDGNGYWLVATDGGIFPFGDAGGYGSTGNIHLNQPIVGMAATPDGGGYWLVATDGGIFPFGDAPGLGSTGNIHLNQPIVGMTAF